MLLGLLSPLLLLRSEYGVKQKEVILSQRRHCCSTGNNLPRPINRGNRPVAVFALPLWILYWQ